MANWALQWARRSWYIWTTVNWNGTYWRVLREIVWHRGQNAV
jgi:hypothetical protein